VFGEDNAQAPLYVVMLGGLFLLTAAVCVAFVRDVGERDVPEREVIDADAHERLLAQPGVQPVPSSGLVDES
jgi:hypothetical protein